MRCRYTGQIALDEVSQLATGYIRVIFPKKQSGTFYFEIRLIVSATLSTSTISRNGNVLITGSIVAIGSEIMKLPKHEGAALALVHDMVLVGLRSLNAHREDDKRLGLKLTDLLVLRGEMDLLDKVDREKFIAFVTARSTPQS
jgi:hypothetical protein